MKNIILTVVIGLFFSLLPCSYNGCLTRRIRTSVDIEQILLTYPQLDREGLLQLVSEIENGNGKINFTLSDLVNFLTALQEVQKFYHNLLGAKSRNIQKIRFDFSPLKPGVKINVRNAELTIYPYSTLFHRAVKNYPRLVAIEEVTHLYTAPGIGLRHPCLQEFWDLLQGKIPHPFLQGFNSEVNLKKYFHTAGGPFSDGSMINTINELLNTYIALQIFSQNYQSLAVHAGAIELEEYKQEIESQSSFSFLPVLARFQITFQLLGAEQLSQNVENYVMELAIPEDLKRSYQKLTADLENFLRGIYIQIP